MGKIWIPGGGGGGVSSDDISLVRANVPNTLTALTRDSDDEIVTGSFDAETNTDDSLVREGKTYVKFNPETKLFEKRTGTEPERTGTYAKNVQWYDSNATALFQGESGHYGSSNANGDYDIRLSAGAAASGLGITSDKIMAGKSIGPVNGAATNDANLVPAAILSGYSGYSKGAKVAGNMVDRGAPTYNLPINGSQALPAGRYTGGTVRQSIPTKGGPSITPQTYGQAISVSGNYMTSDGYVAGVPLPPADAIKKGYRFYIGSNYVDGTWQGYTDNPLYLFNYGTWSNLQTPGMSNTVLEGNHLKKISSEIAVLNQTVDLTNYNYLHIYADVQYAIEMNLKMRFYVNVSKDNKTIDYNHIQNGNGAQMNILDISSLSGFYYIIAHGFSYYLSGANVSSEARIYQIYLSTR